MAEILEKKVVAKFDRFELYLAKARLDNGNIVNYNFIKFPITVSIVPIDENENVFLCKEWRLAWNRNIIQIPAGVCENNGEESDPEKRAHEELLEEVGMKAGNIEKLISTAISANSNGIHHIFLATKLTKSQRKLEENEIIEVMKMPIKKAYKMFTEGEITTSYTLLGLKLAMERLKI